MPRATNQHLEAAEGVELRQFGYPKYATLIAAPGTGQRGEIVEIGNVLHYWHEPAGRWVRLPDGQQVYPFLKDTGGTESAAIQADFDTGLLELGDPVVTNAYTEGSSFGGASYLVVATGTGTDDGGEFIDFAGFQLQAVFPGLVDVTQFGALGDGVADDTNAIKAAYDAIPAGWVLKFPPARTFRLDQLQVRRSIKIDARGSTLVQIDDSPIIQWFSSPETKISVTGITTVVWTAPNAANTSTVSQLTLASAPPFSAGDVIKIASEDSIPGGESTNQRVGEFVVVGEVTGTTVTLTQQLFDSYVTNPEVAPLSSLKADIQGGEFYAEAAGDAAGWNANMLRFQNCGKVTIKGFDMHDSYGAAIALLNCYDVDISDGSLYNLSNEPSNNRFGYGITAQSSSFGRVSKVYARNLRHLITSSTAQSANTTFENRGRASHWVITGCSGQGNHSATFDTHQTAYDWSFFGCQSAGVFSGESSEGTGFNLRGTRILAFGCTSDSEVVGFNVFSANPGGSEDISIINCAAYTSAKEALRVRNNSGTTLAGLIKVASSLFQSSGPVLANLFDAGKMSITDTEFVSTSTAAGTEIIFAERNVQLRMRACTFDMSAATGANNRIVHWDTGASGSADFSDISLVLGGTLESVFREESGTAPLTVRSITSSGAALPDPYIVGWSSSAIADPLLGLVPQGPTGNRPTLTSTDRAVFFDDTLGRIVIWDGTGWFNADGSGPV